MRLTRQQLEDIWYEATSLRPADPISSSAINKAMKGGGADYAEAIGATCDSAGACDAIRTLANDCLAFAKGIAEAQEQEGT